eukprot:159077-Chlamydomonas_euryale.AAC.1
MSHGHKSTTRRAAAPFHSTTPRPGTPTSHNGKLQGRQQGSGRQGCGQEGRRQGRQEGQEDQEDGRDLQDLPVQGAQA